MSRTYWASVGSSRGSDEYDSLVKDLENDIEEKEAEDREREEKYDIIDKAERARRYKEDPEYRNKVDLRKKTRMDCGTYIPVINFSDLPTSTVQRELTDEECSKIAEAYSIARTRVDYDDFDKFKKYFNENLILIYGRFESIDLRVPYYSGTFSDILRRNYLIRKPF